jgi:hypothetical protein
VWALISTAGPYAERDVETTLDPAGFIQIIAKRLFITSNAVGASQETPEVEVQDARARNSHAGDL